MSNERRTYHIVPITVNGHKIVQVVIDTHYEKRHHDSMSDSLILNLVSQLDGRQEIPDARKGPYAYFATLVEHRSKQYRLIWLLENDAIYIGIVNAYGYLTGAVVLKEHRGCGAYRALIQTRLADLHELSFPFAVTQAREATSAPILEKLGFETAFRAKIYRFTS